MGPAMGVWGGNHSVPHTTVPQKGVLQAKQIDVHYNLRVARIWTGVVNGELSSDGESALTKT